MSLLGYEQAFSSLKMNQRGANKSPHKMAMLLAVMDLFNEEVIKDNHIYFNAPLITAFEKHFKALAGPNDNCNPSLPFFHLRSSGFWHHHAKPGQQALYEGLTSASSANVIDKTIAYVQLDDELFELLSYSVARECLKHALYENLTQQRRNELLAVGNGWNWLETEATVQDYFAMLGKELKGEQYNKSAHRRALTQKLNSRKEGAVEFKHQNISAVLIEMGQPYIAGYKPAFNYQQQLKNVVLAHLAAHQNQFDELLQTAEAPAQNTPIANIQWENVLDTELPEKLTQIQEPPRQYLARKTNFTQREQRNRQLGEKGEAFVIEFERQRLISANRADLAQEVQWSSQEKGDGLGYDVRSFQWRNNAPIEEERYIEVKTTNSGKYQPFYISENERAYSKQHPKSYSLYRVYDFNKQSRIFQLHGAIEAHVHLNAQNYRASFN